MPMFRSAVFTLALLAAPAALSAQQPAAAPAPTPAEQETRAWLQELQQIGAKLQALQVQALTDPALKAQHEALGAEIESAVRKADPSLAGLTERVQALDTQIREAQQKGDRDAFQKLVTEGRQLEERFVRARATVLQDPALAAKAKSFGETLEKKMIELDASLPRMLARGQELQGKLETALKAQQPPARKR